jgi:type IV pilus assembly protein PilE
MVICGEDEETRSMKLSALEHRRRTRGFTLIELMIAVVVVAILAGLAYPSFMSSIRKSRRAEAFASLATLQQAQERWRGNHSAYTTELTASPPAGLGLNTSSSGGLYTISVADVDTNQYQAIATAVSGKSQAADGNCAKLGVRMQAGQLSYAGASAAGTLTFAGTHECWSR